MASTDTYTVYTLFTEDGYGPGGYEMKIYCKEDAAREDYPMASTAEGECLKCDHCDEVVLGDTFQPFATEVDGDAGYLACLPCYVQGVVDGAVEMAIVSERTLADAASSGSGRHAA